MCAEWLRSLLLLAVVGGRAMLRRHCELLQWRRACWVFGVVVCVSAVQCVGMSVCSLPFDFRERALLRCCVCGTALHGRSLRLLSAAVVRQQRW